MKEKDKYYAVATAVRVERDDDSFYLVFKITDEKFKQKVKKDWLQDIDLKIVDKKLFEFNEEE